MNRAQLETLMAEVQKNSGLSATAFKEVRKEAQRKVKRAKGFLSKKKQKEKSDDAADEQQFNKTPDMHLYERCFLGDQKFVVINDTFYAYQTGAGYWEPIQDQDVLKHVLDASHRTWKWAGTKDAKYKKYCGSQSAANSALKYARGMLTLTDKKKPSNQHLRAFKNCTVDLRTGHMSQHSPGNYLTSAIACDYEEGLECPEIFTEFLRVSYGDDMIPVVRAAISMLLDPTAPWGKFIHIIGPSGSGKGVLLRLLQELFGKENSRGGSSFSDFADADKRHQSLKGCALYVIGDIAGYQRGLEVFYDLVDNAPMSGRALFSSSSYTEKWNVRFAIASVEYLQLENSAGGWDRRVLPILTQRRPESADIENLEARLAEARGGIISWALAMPKEERDAILRKPWDYSERISNAMHESRVHGDSIASFVDCCLRPVTYGSRVVAPEMNQGHMHDLYLAYCRANLLQPKGKPKFIGHLKTLIPGHYEPRRRLRADETGERDSQGKPPRIPARWTWLEPEGQAFDFKSEDEDGGGTWIFRKSFNKEGNLDLFNQWEKTEGSGNELPQTPAQSSSENPDMPAVDLSTPKGSISDDFEIF